jgi:hypothetical protein
MLPLVEEALKDCNFFSLDCEMTGLFVDGSKDDYLDEMCDRWIVIIPFQTLKPECSFAAAATADVKKAISCSVLHEGMPS